MPRAHTVQLLSLLLSLTACDGVHHTAAAAAQAARVDVDNCLAASAAVAERRRARNGPAAADEPSDAGAVAAACAPLFHEAPCREAHLHFDVPPAAVRAATVLQACRDAYCPKLAAPLPKACAAQAADTDDPMAVFQSWNDLRTAIYRHDLGDAATERLLAAEAR